MCDQTTGECNACSSGSVYFPDATFVEDNCESCDDMSCLTCLRHNLCVECETGLYTGYGSCFSDVYSMLKFSSNASSTISCGQYC